MRFPSPRLTRRSYVALTIAGILLPTLLLGALGLHLVQRHADFQEQILQEYSRFSVEYAATEIERAIFEQEGDIANYLQMAALVEPFQAPEELRRAELTHPSIENAFVYNRNGSIVFARWTPLPTNVGDEGRRASTRDLQRRPRAERIVQRLLDPETVRHVLLSGDIHFYTGLEDSIPYHVAVFPDRGAGGVERGVMGFFLDIDHLQMEVVGQVLERSILTAEGRFAPDFGRVLTLVIRDGGNGVVYTHHRPGSSAEEAKRMCPTRDLARASLGGVVPGWSVGITYAQPGGFGWGRRIFFSQITLLVLAAVVVVIGTLVTMRFALRQMELSRVKSHFVSNITHELKTPLAAIRLYTETLQQGRVRDRTETERFLGIIHKETGRLTALINNILDFARIENGRRQYRFAPAAVGDIVREVVDAYSYQFRQNGFEIEIEIEDGLPPTRVDRDAMSQAVLNLLDNSMKYSRDEKHIQVRVRRGEAAGVPAASHGAPALASPEPNGNGRGTILVEVSDRGIGIPQAERRRIFEAFYRVDKGLEHDVKGSGLGLAVVQHIVEAHGGSVEVESLPETGSRFTLKLPIAEADA